MLTTREAELHRDQHRRPRLRRHRAVRLPAEPHAQPRPDGAEGRKLTSHYAAPVCSPSRAALLTGCYPKGRVLPIPWVLFPAAAIGLNPGEETIAELLRNAGYATACVGKWHLGDQPESCLTQQGFDSLDGIPYSNDMGPAEDGSEEQCRPADSPASRRTRRPPTMTKPA